MIQKTPAKTFIIPARRKQFIQENIFNKAPVRRIVIANSAFIGLYTENPFWYQRLVLRHITKLRRGQPIVDLDAADKICLYVTTRQALNFKDDVTLFLFHNFKDHSLPVFDFTSMQDDTQNFHYPELFAEPLRHGLNFAFPVEDITNSFYWKKEYLRLQLTSFKLLEKTSKVDIFLQQTFNRIPSVKYRYRGSFRSDYVPTLEKDAFAIINKQPSLLQGKPWILTANSRQILYFADSLGR